MAQFLSQYQSGLCLSQKSVIKRWRPNSQDNLREAISISQSFWIPFFVTVHGYQNALLALYKRSSQCPVVGRVRSGKWKNIHATLPCSNLKRGKKTRMLPEWSPYFRIRYSVRVSVLGSMLTMLTNAIPRMVNLASHVPHLVLQTLLAARLT